MTSEGKKGNILKGWRDGWKLRDDFTFTFATDGTMFKSYLLKTNKSKLTRNKGVDLIL